MTTWAECNDDGDMGYGDMGGYDDMGGMMPGDDMGYGGYGRIWTTWAE